MKLYLTTNLTSTLERVLSDLNDVLRPFPSKDFDFELEVNGSELTLKFDERVLNDLLGTYFEEYCNEGGNSLTKYGNSLTLNLELL